MPKLVKSNRIEIVYENNAGDFIERFPTTRDEAMSIIERDGLVIEQIITDGGVECWFACVVTEQPTLI